MAVKSLAQSSILQPSNVNSMLGSYESNYFHHLETVRLGSTAASVTFSNLDQYADYQHLQLRVAVRDTHSSIADARLGMRMNGVTTASYMTHVLFSRGSGITSEGVNSGSYDTQIRICQDIMSGNAPAGAFTASTIDILDAFETSKFKTVRGLSGHAASSYLINLTSGFYNSTSAISSITLFSLQGTSLAANSRFSLYGIKAR